jgi:hypothetical protein
MYDTVPSFLGIIGSGKNSLIGYSDEADSLFLEGNTSDVRILLWIAQTSVHIAHLRRKCHKSKFGIFEFLI